PFTPAGSATTWDRRWQDGRSPSPIHDPAKFVTDIANTLALGDDADRALATINTVPAAARAQAWELAGAQAPSHCSDARSPMTIELDARLDTAQSGKEQAPPAYKTGVRVPSPAGVHRPRELWLRRTRRATVASQQCGIEYRRRPSR